jgi:hypothetical protein
LTPETVKKLDTGKLRMDLIPPEWDEGLAQVLQMGAEKYAPNAWIENPMESWRVEAALMRHVAARRRGETVDAESGLDHWLHAAWNCLCLYYYELKGLTPDTKSN